jgi:hypothetical protein
MIAALRSPATKAAIAHIATIAAHPVIVTKLPMDESKPRRRYNASQDLHTDEFVEELATCARSL